MQAQLRKFLKQVEDLQTAKEQHFSSKPNLDRSESASASEKSKSVDEDGEKMPEKFEVKEHKQGFDGWDLYKKNKISMQPVRKYIAHVDTDYKRNKVTVCANLSNIYNTFIVRHGRPGPAVNNFFDIEKWLAKFGQCAEDAPSKEKDLKRMNTVGNFNEDKAALLKQESVVNKDATHQRSLLLPKSLSTHHIPQQARSKYSKRIYANYDKENAVRMFGYRAVFSRDKMAIKVPDPYASQKHKPLEKYVHDIVSDLNS